MRLLTAVAAGWLAATSIAAAQTYQSSAGDLKVETVVGGLVHPWALAFLPDGRMLITEKPGRMRIATKDGKLSQPLAGLPRIAAAGQGGLLDVVLDRNFAQNRTIYFCYSAPVEGGAQTAMARARLAEERLDDVKRIFIQEGPPSSTHHFGCRIAQAADNTLFLTLGDHLRYRDEAQNLANHLGKVVRIAPDGSVPKDNPFVGRADAKPEIWSYGHRNSQGAAIHPTSGKFWMHEHGPRGGDEVNIPEKGKNYGWPVIGYGIDYSGARIHQGTQKAGMEQPIKYWVPSIGPSGLAFYQGDLFPDWRGSMFVGALVTQLVVRLQLDGEKVVSEERILQGIRERIRDVRQGPDGALYLVTDNTAGRILRVAPADQARAGTR